MFRDRVFEQFARITKALASPKRLEVIDLLAQAERTVEELARLSGMSVANASRHLQILRAARMVEVRRVGVFAHYRLADAGVERVWSAIKTLGEARFAEIEEVLRSFFADRSKLETISVSELRGRMGDPHVLVLDVRPKEEFNAGHIPGALSIPVTDLEALLPQLPRDRDWVAYCRGRYSLSSGEAVVLMRERGFAARWLDAGVAEWRAAGLPVEVG